MSGREYGGASAFHGRWEPGELAGGYFNGTSQVWTHEAGTMPKVAVMHDGLTADRPAGAITGQNLFDRTLRKPIWWDGSAWVDATEAPSKTRDPNLLNGPPRSRAPGVAVMNDPSAHIRPLTGIRAVAAWWVVLFHLRELSYQLIPALASLEPILGVGYVGVDVFFILSGFVIHHTYAAKFRRARAAMLLPFLRARVARIWPLHIATAAATVGIALSWTLIGSPDPFPPSYSSPRIWAANILMVEDWTIPPIGSINYVAWSVSAEWLAYVCFPVLVISSAFIRGRVFLVLGVFILTAAWGYLSTRPDLPYLTVPRVLLLFTAGVLLSRLHKTEGAPRPPGTVVTTLTILALILPTAFHLAGKSPLLASPVIAAAIYGLAHERGSASRRLSGRRVVLWGVWSYAVYLVHPQVFEVYQRLLPYLTRTTESKILYAATLVLSLLAVAVAARVAYAAVERPAQVLLRGRHQEREGQARA